MKTQLFAIFYVIGIIMVLQACTVKYVPNVLNTPMFSKAGEVNLASNIAISGFDPQLSASVTDHIGVMLNGSFWNINKNPSDISSAFTSHKFMEFGAGYFTKEDEILRFEVYGGYGLGNFYSQYNELQWSPYTNSTFIKSEVDCSRFFVQPGFGISTKYFEMNLASRFSNVNFLKDSESESNLKNSLEGINCYFVEPALTLKGGIENVKVILQCGTSISLNNSYNIFTNNNSNMFSFNPLILSIGLQYRFEPFARKHKININNVEVDSTWVKKNNL